MVSEIDTSEKTDTSEKEGRVASLARRRHRVTRSLLALPLGWLVLFFIIPVSLVVAYSVGILETFTKEEGVSLETWRIFLTGENVYMLLFIKSFRMALIVAVVVVILAYPIAYFLAMIADKYKYSLLLLMIAPFMTNFFMRVMAWKVLLGRQGVLNSFLIWSGLRDEGNPIEGLAFGEIPVMIVLGYVWIPFVMLPMFAAMISMDRRLLEAAADLGASRWRAFWKVTFPLSLPGVVASFFFVFIPTIGEFVVPKLVGGTKGYMFGSAIDDLFGMGLDWRTGSVLSLWLVMAVFILALLFMRLVRFGRLAES